MTITEALAELKTLEKRISAKREFIRSYFIRTDNLKDPFEKDGGSEKKVQEEQQALSDLETRAVTLRRAIQSANEATVVTVGKTEMTIADWLVWRRDIAPSRERFLKDLRMKLTQSRDMINRQFMPDVNGTKINLVVNIDEGQLNKQIEEMEKIAGELDGQLSLKNATVMVEV